MSKATVVRYTTRPEAAEENELLIRGVFAELAEQAPEDFRYVAIRLDDGVSFVHIALVDGDNNPLPTFASFREFVSAIDSRCADGPTPANGTVIGNYRKQEGN
jgi:hypothetical protein